MTDTERKMLRSFVSMRQEIALDRLKENDQYTEICRRQKETDDIAEELLHKLEKGDRITIRRHYEGETEKTCFELNEVYKQGLCDSVKILALLGVFGAEVNL